MATGGTRLDLAPIGERPGCGWFQVQADRILAVNLEGPLEINVGDNMPGARWRSFRLGDRSELLVEHLLAGFAFTTKVPRQEDIGIDFLCSLITSGEDARLLKAGPFFAVQAKRSADEIVYENSHEIEWITHQENPLLLCVADRETASMDVYSTWNLLCGVLGGGWEGKEKPRRIVLKPGKSEVWPGVKNYQDGSQEIFLGKPIARITHADLVNPGRTEEIAEVLSSWVALDRTNIVNRYAGMYLVLGPLSYETGRMPYGEGKGGVSFYWHPNNLNKCAENLARSVAGLLLIYRNFVSEPDVKLEPWSDRVATLNAALRSHWALFDEPVKQFLTQMNLKP